MSAATLPVTHTPECLGEKTRRRDGSIGHAEKSCPSKIYRRKSKINPTRSARTAPRFFLLIVENFEFTRLDLTRPILYSVKACGRRRETTSGRPEKRWIDEPNRNFRALGVHNLAKDREEWRRPCGTRWTLMAYKS